MEKQNLLKRRRGIELKKVFVYFLNSIQTYFEVCPFEVGHPPQKMFMLSTSSSSDTTEISEEIECAMNTYASRHCNRFYLPDTLACG